MKRGRLAISLVTLALFIGVGAYMAYYIIAAFSNPLVISEAVYATAEETIVVNGYFARDEYLLSPSSAGGITETVVAEGEKVAKGETLAVSYASGASADSKRRLRALQKQLDELKSAVSGAAAPGDSDKLDAGICEYISMISYDLGSAGRLTDGEAVSLLKTSVLRRDYAHGRFSAEDAAAEQESLASRIASLETASSGAEIALRAPTSGYFSSAADGYENVLTYDGVLELSAADLDALSGLLTETPADCPGKISTSFTWRFAAALPAEKAAQLSEGRWYDMRLRGDYVGDLRVRAYSIGQTEEDGRCVAVFSCSRCIGELLSLRRQSVEVILTSYSGIRVPKNALRVDENGQNGVYILLAAQARFVPVKQLYEADTYYIVEYDHLTSSALRPGDEIIVGSRELYDGKVVQ